MWKQFYAAIKQLLLLTHQTDENREQIKELRIKFESSHLL